MHFDNRTPRKPMAGLRHSRRRGRKMPILLLLLAGIASLFILANRPSVHDTEAHTAPAIEPLGATSANLEPKREILEGTIQPGETISSLLGDYFSSQEIHELASQSRRTFPLSDLCAGQPYRLCVTGKSFESFEYDIDRNDQLIIRRDDGKLDVSRVPIDYTVRAELVRGTIATNLFDAVASAGENAELAVELAEIFAYDIDFIRDLRHGDSFQAVLEKRYRDGAPAGYGRILAAEFTNQGKPSQAFLFRDGNRPVAYYNARGESLRTMFLRAPLAFSRISSGFSMKRFHPIAKTWRAHPAIDYAAATGTPIHAVGDGTVVRSGYTGGNGKFVKIRHGSGYESMYLHMSRFAKGMATGKRVRQGDVIGFVGSSGLATGPHLCFRMTRNGAPVNPNKVIRTAAAAPVSRERLSEFRASIAPLTARLEGGDSQEVQAAVVPAGENEPKTR